MTAVIPNVFHRIWLGSKPLPPEFRAFGDTWRRHHPGWEMWLWRDEHLDDLALPSFFYHAESHTERSDILRCELLRRFGGVYVDTDFECRQRLDDLIEGLTMFAGYYMPGEVCNALIGAAPHHPVLEAALTRLPARVGVVPFPDSTGPTFFTELMGDFPDVRLFEPAKFYPYLWTELHRRDEEFPDAYAIHHWAGSWQGEDKLRLDLKVLQGRLAKVEARREKAERRRDKEEARRRHATARLTVTKRRLRSMLRTRWWRLGQVGAAVVHYFKPGSPRGQ